MVAAPNRRRASPTVVPHPARRCGRPRRGRVRRPRRVRRGCRGPRPAPSCTPRGGSSCPRRRSPDVGRGADRPPPGIGTARCDRPLTRRGGRRRGGVADPHRSRPLAGVGARPCDRPARTTAVPSPPASGEPSPPSAASASGSGFDQLTPGLSWSWSVAGVHAYRLPGADRQRMPLRLSVPLLAAPVPRGLPDRPPPDRAPGDASESDLLRRQESAAPRLPSASRRPARPVPGRGHHPARRPAQDPHGLPVTDEAGPEAPGGDEPGILGAVGTTGGRTEAAPAQVGPVLVADPAGPPGEHGRRRVLPGRGRADVSIDGVCKAPRRRPWRRPKCRSNVRRQRSTHSCSPS